MAQLFTKVSGRYVWWATPVECDSAIARRLREGVLREESLEMARSRLGRILTDVHSIGPTEDVRARARRLVATHPLRAADAFQLAAALVWCEEHPAGETFFCLDDRLREAARLEGFTVLPAA